MWGTVGIAGSTNRTEQPNQGEIKEDKTKDPIALNNSIDVEADRIKRRHLPFGFSHIVHHPTEFQKLLKMGSQPVLLGFLDAAMGEGEGHYSINKVIY